MEGKSALTVICVVLCFCATGCQEPPNICEQKGCSCLPLPDSSSWQKVNCTFTDDQRVFLGANSVPRRASEVILTGGELVHLHSFAFNRLEGLERLLVKNSRLLHVEKAALNGSLGSQLRLEILDCGRAVFDPMSVKDPIGQTDVTISRCDAVNIEKEAFSWLTQISISDVGMLNLKKGALYKKVAVGHHGSDKRIHISRAVIPLVPAQAFGPAADEILLRSTDMWTVQDGAFSGMTFNAVIAINCSIGEIQSGAFSSSGLVHNLEFQKCNISKMHTGALLAPCTNLTFQNLTVKEISSGAVKSIVGSVVITDSTFHKVRSSGMDFSAWTKMRVERNLFDLLEPDAIHQTTGENKHDCSFTFMDNAISVAQSGSLNFLNVINNFPNVKFNYERNFFENPCSCSNWLSSVFDNSSSLITSIMKNSYCTVEDTIAKCFNISDLNMLIDNYTQQLCGKEDSVRCFSSSVTDKIVNTKFRKKNGISEEDAAYRSKTILVLILLIALCGSLLIIVIVTILWAKRKGHFTNIKNAVISSDTSCGTFFDRLFNINYGLDTARSISRLSINEYNESIRLNECRTLHMEDVLEADQVTEELVETSDKSTQTLPEELTKELLESLRLKLDDENCYNEAREMIEHLYDLIKVEESCNSNTMNTNQMEEPTEQDNLYDVIQVPSRSMGPRQGKSGKTMISVGTRTPSFERLPQSSPYSRPTALSHTYFEPRDRTVHLYSELQAHSSRLPDVLTPSRPHSFLRVVGERAGLGQASTAGLPAGDSGSHRSAGSSRSATSQDMRNRPLPEKPKS